MKWPHRPLNVQSLGPFPGQCPKTKVEPHPSPPESDGVEHFGFMQVREGGQVFDASVGRCRRLRTKAVTPHPPNRDDATDEAGDEAGNNPLSPKVLMVGACVYFINALK